MNNDEYLDNVFMALSDRKRRKMLEMLSESQMLVTELGKPFGMSKQATSKHLGVLEKAGFVNKEKDGRVRRCALNPKPLQEVSKFVQQYHQFWEEQFDALEDFIQKNIQEGESNDS